ncbi:GPI anchored protein [Penicillium brasilianum]|uniref:GPI anchored protein n=1 Tax=Penicillium brasilianum TaxID=104259 RepID=A0A1S9RI56_PENBI|nr:GPI anchored protein [Penicillium brasilianum]
MKFPLLTLALAPLAAAHFQLQYPTSRGFDEDTMPDFPCGGMSQSSNRTQIPISGSFPVALKMGHSQTAVEVLLALGSNPGDNYNITLVHTFQVTGLGAFCLPHVEFSDDILGVNITDGLNATLQVQSNGDPSGGLYACADVQFSSSVTYSEPSSCTNNTNVVASAFSGAAAQRNANESTSTGSAQSSSSSSSSSNTTSTTSKGAAVPLQTAAWGLLGAAFAGGMAVL